MHKVLAIDDDQGFLDSIVNLLSYKGFQTSTLSNPNVAIEQLSKEKYHIVLLDVKMPGKDGRTLLDEIIKEFPHIPVVMISGQSTLSIAVDSIKQGAYDFLEKPVDVNRLLVTIQNAISKYEWRIEKKLLLDEVFENFNMIGQSPAMQHLFKQIEIAAPTDGKVLITGETGTGKELVAKAIHYNSKRSAQKYIKVNCAAIPENLTESELFGHKKGSFTGAFNDKTGRFEEADGGTILLDEIGELDINIQAKLLRVLQDGEIQKIGDMKPVKVDVRIIAATNKDLNELIKKRQFREDLYHRLSVITLHIISLRERKGDIPELANYFLQKFANKYNKAISSFKNDALYLLQEHEWPGNVRELENVIERIVIFATDPVISRSHILFGLQSVKEEDSSIKNLKEHLQIKEKEYISRMLLLTNNKKSETARLLGLDRATLWKKIQKLGI